MNITFGTPMIAQLDLVKPDFLMQAMALAGVITLAYFQWRQTTRQNTQRQIGPLPLEIDQVEKHVTKTMCELTHRDIERRFARIEADLSAIRSDLATNRKEISDKIGHVHDRINDVLKLLTAFKRDQDTSP